MDAVLFAKMLSDKHITDLKRLKYKYPDADIKEFVNLLKMGMYKELPIKDFSGNALVYLDSVAQVHMAAAKTLLTPQRSAGQYGIKAMEEEIASTLTIENIDFFQGQRAQDSERFCSQRRQRKTHLWHEKRP